MAKKRVKGSEEVQKEFYNLSIITSDKQTCNSISNQSNKVHDKIKTCINKITKYTQYNRPVLVPTVWSLGGPVETLDVLPAFQVQSKLSWWSLVKPQRCWSSKSHIWTGTAEQNTSKIKTLHTLYTMYSPHNHTFRLRQQNHHNKTLPEMSADTAKKHWLVVGWQGKFETSTILHVHKCGNK